MIAFPSPLPRWALLLLLLALGSIWGGTFSLARIGASGGISPLGYSLYFHLGAACGLVALMAAQGARPRFSRNMLGYFLIGSMLANTVPSLAMFISVRHVPTGLVAVFVTLAPAVTYSLALAAGLERFDARRALGTALGFAGTLLIVLPRASLPSRDMVPWVLLALCIPLFYGSSTVYAALKRPAGLDSWTNAAMFMFASVAVVLPVSLAAGEFHVPGTVPLYADLILLLHATLGVASQFLLYEILRVAGPVVVSQVAYIVTLTALFWGWLLFGERHSAWVWLATAIILAGVALVTWPGRKRSG